MAITKSEGDGAHPSSHYLVVEDATKPSTWHLRVKDSSGNVDRGLCGAAWAALHGGYRGHTYQGPGKQDALRKLTAIYKRMGWDLPDSQNSAHPTTITAEAVAFAVADDLDMVERTGKVFEAGAWPDKDYAMTEDELDAAIADFSPVPVKIEHVDSVLDDKLGMLAEVWREGAALMGRVQLPSWLAEVLHDTELKVSACWDRASKRLRELSLVTEPRIEGAAIYSAYAAFAGRRHSASDQADMQQIHDIATRQGADCEATGVRRQASEQDGDEEHFSDRESAQSSQDAGRGATLSPLSCRLSPAMSRTEPAPAPTDKPARKKGRMNLKDWILGKAQEDGVEIDDVQAAFTGDPALAGRDDEARAQLAALEAQKKALAEQVDALRQQNEAHAAAFARAAQEKRQADAVSFAQQAMGAHRIAPAAQEALAALHARCATLDASVTFSDGEKSTCALLAELVAALPDLSLFTTEHIQPDQVAALFTQRTTPGDAGTPAEPSREKLDALLAKTQVGRAVLKDRGAQQKQNGS